jgi:hypothetical protein
MAEILEIIEVWQHFQEIIWTLQQPLAAGLSMTPLQTTDCYTAITADFDQLILAAPTYRLPPATAGKMRSYITEIHRLLKLIQRDLIFWHNARQPSTKAQRHADILSKLDVITQFIQSMIEELNIAGSL